MGKDDLWQQLAPVREARLRYWLRAVSSDAPVDVASRWLEENPDHAELARRWETLTTGEQQAAASELEELLRAAAYASRPFCIHCGQCCKNAGPTLHPGDEELLRRGVVSRAQLRTVRAGEDVFSHWEGRRVVLEHEQVTVSPTRDRACRFWDRFSQRCTIHELRPLQCRAQQCWDTAEADRLASTPGLTRLDLLAAGDPLREAVVEHDRLCPPALLRELASEARQDPGGRASGALLELVEADLELRSRLVERGLASAAELPFLLGAVRLFGDGHTILRI